MDKSVRGGFRMLWHAYTKCDEFEHLYCDNGHHEGIVYGWDEEPTECSECRAPLRVQLDRDLMARLAKIQIKDSMFPHRLMTLEPTEKTDVTWYWRGRRLFAYKRKNPFKEWMADD